MKTIHVLWATVRPQFIYEALQRWVTAEAVVDRVRHVVAIHSLETSYCRSLYELCLALDCPDSDIVIAAQDDIYPPALWDSVVLQEFETFDGALIWEDGIRNNRLMYPMACLTFSALKKLNRIILHPDYYHCRSDVEAYTNLTELGILKDISKVNPAVFAHRHYTQGWRAKDAVDDYAAHRWGGDAGTFNRRMKLSLEERLKVIT